MGILFFLYLVYILIESLKGYSSKNNPLKFLLLDYSTLLFLK